MRARRRRRRRNVVEESLHGVQSQQAGWMESPVDRSTPTGTYIEEAGGPYNRMWWKTRCMGCDHNWLAGWNLP